MPRLCATALTARMMTLLLMSACGGNSAAPQAVSAGIDAGSERDSSVPNERRNDAALSGDMDAAATTDAAAGRVSEEQVGTAADGGVEPSDSGAGSEPNATVPDANVGDRENDSGADMLQNLCTSCGGCEETQNVVSNMHTPEDVKYTDLPPTSGPHNPCWARWGIHEQPVRAERWVHNLEHGGVVFLYHCPDGCDAEVATLTMFANMRQRTVLTEYADLPARFAAVSWGHRIVSDCLDEQAFAAFYARNFDRAPESIATAPNPGCPP